MLDTHVAVQGKTKIITVTDNDQATKHNIFTALIISLINLTDRNWVPSFIGHELVQIKQHIESTSRELTAFQVM